MPSCHCFVAFTFLILCCCGCGENPLNRESSPTEASVDESSVIAGDGNSDHGSAIDTPVEVPNEDRFKLRLGRLFESVLPVLDDARELVDRHAELPDRSRIPFKPDKQSNSAAINQLLDQAIDVLAISEVSDYRLQIREATAAIAESHANIADYQRQRVSASWAKDQSQIENFTPFEQSKEAMEQLYADERA